MSDNKLLGIGIVGTVIAALCCFTPVLVILLGAVGLAASTSSPRTRSGREKHPC